MLYARNILIDFDNFRFSTKLNDGKWFDTYDSGTIELPLSLKLPFTRRDYFIISILAYFWNPNIDIDYYADPKIHFVLDRSKSYLKNILVEGGFPSSSDRDFNEFIFKLLKNFTTVNIFSPGSRKIIWKCVFIFEKLYLLEDINVINFRFYQMINNNKCSITKIVGLQKPVSCLSYEAWDLLSNPFANKTFTIDSFFKFSLRMRSSDVLPIFVDPLADFDLFGIGLSNLYDEIDFSAEKEDFLNNVANLLKSKFYGLVVIFELFDQYEAWFLREIIDEFTSPKTYRKVENTTNGKKIIVRSLLDNLNSYFVILYLTKYVGFLSIKWFIYLETHDFFTRFYNNYVYLRRSHLNRSWMGLIFSDYSELYERLNQNNTEVDKVMAGENDFMQGFVENLSNLDDELRKNDSGGQVAERNDDQKIVEEKEPLLDISSDDLPF